MWKKGRGTTASSGKLAGVYLMDNSPYRAGGSMRAAIYVRVSFDDGRQTVENQEQQLVE